MARLILNVEGTVTIDRHAGHLDVSGNVDLADLATQLTVDEVAEFVTAVGADAVLAHVGSRYAVAYYDLKLVERKETDDEPATSKDEV